jgi:hypothetical protein
MQRFRDRKGREWTLEANFGSYGRVKAATGVKLYDIATENRECLTQLTDVLILGQVLWSMVEPQAQAIGVSPEDFAGAFDGDVIETAYNALLDEMLFFCPTRQRKVLEVAVRKVREVEARAATVVDGKLEKFEQEIDRALDQLTHGFLDTSLPESSESTRENGRSESFSTPHADAREKTGITPVPCSPRSQKSTATQRSEAGHTTLQSCTPCVSKPTRRRSK